MDLFAPGMTVTHRVGLAGLWMTLQALAHDPLEKPAQNALRGAGGDWDLTPTSVVLRWQRGFAPFWKALREQAFRVDPEGFIWLPALGRPADAVTQAAIRQWALLGSVLQHPRTRKADSLAKPEGSCSLEQDDGGTPVIVRFPRVEHYAHQDAEVRVDRENQLAGWHLPGGTVRHVGLGAATPLAEPADRFLPLLFLPAGALYFEAVTHHGGGTRSTYAVVLPEVQDLEVYATTLQDGFRGATARRMQVAGASEAAARTLARLNAVDRSQEMADYGGVVRACHVVLFGGVPWSQQRTRVEVLDAVLPREADDRRTLAHAFRADDRPFPVRRVQPNHGAAFWDVPQAPELLARNVLAGRPWWSGFSAFVADPTCGEHVMRWEKEGLAQMLDDTAEPERTFVQACHEAWQSRAGQLGDRARDEAGGNQVRQKELFEKLYAQEFARVRVLLLRCKSAANFRDAITDFWTRAGRSLPSLQGQWATVLPFLGDRRWREGRDLALLALASYRGHGVASGGGPTDGAQRGLTQGNGG